MERILKSIPHFWFIPLLIEDSLDYGIPYEGDWGQTRFICHIVTLRTPNLIFLVCVCFNTFAAIHTDHQNKYSNSPVIFRVIYEQHCVDKQLLSCEIVTPHLLHATIGLMNLAHVYGNA